MKYELRPQDIELVNNAVSYLSDKYEGKKKFTRYYEENCDSGYATDLLIELFELDPEEDLDWGGAFLDILYNNDYPEMDVTLLEFADYTDEAQMLVKMWINENYEALKEEIEEYLAESEI